MRTEIYRILSECFKEPCREFAENVAQGGLFQELSNYYIPLGIIVPLEGLRIPGEVEAVLQALKDQYYSLFVGPFPPFALPVESVYKEWAQAGESPLIDSGVRGMLMGNPAIDMLKRYRMLGIEIPTECKDMPDHLALLLEYMAILCENGTEEEQKRFLQEHLDWIPELKRLIYECSESRFYRTVATATAAFVAHEQQALNHGGSREPYDGIAGHP